MQISKAARLEPEDSKSRVPVTVGQVNHNTVWSIKAPHNQSATGITEYSFIPRVGASTCGLWGKVRGEKINVFPSRNLKEIEQGLASGDSNFAFKRLNTPLFPNTNRLLPDASGDWKLNQDFEATVEGFRVRMKLNNQASTPGSIPHQLHGLLFNAKPVNADTGDEAGDAVTYIGDAQKTSTSTTFKDFFNGYWTGNAEVKISQTLEKGAFLYEIESTNTGTTAMPVGFGSHPYFQMPGGDPSQATLVIPSTRYAEIDNFDNVLPTGRFLPTAGSAYDFNPGNHTRLNRIFDNYFLLDTDQRYVELIDRKKKVRYRMTALTDNIVGAQTYYPGQGDVIAIEMVTHHPDPREALWGSERTGIQILQPGRTAKYAYKIEVLEL